MAKEPGELKWIESLFEEHEYRRKSMFGGFAYYVQEKMIMASFEGTGSRVYRKKKYPFEIWNGCMFPVEKEYQDQALQKFSFLIPHPVLPKWLYLPLETENFEELAEKVLSQALRPDGYWGSIPKGKAKGRTVKLKESTLKTEKIDTRKPRMFSDEPAENALARLKNISELKNLGPKAEANLRKAGIPDVKTFVKLGWKKTMIKMIAKDPKFRHSMWAYALIGAIGNKDWNAVTEAEREEARNFVRALPRPKKKT